MPSKKRRLGRKVPLTQHPLAEHWMTLSTAAKAIAAETQQQQQYIALLRQVSDVTQHDSTVPDNPWTSEQVDFEDVRNYVLTWLDDFDDNVTQLTRVRDEALDVLKKADSDEELKSSAVVLTEAEMNLKKLDAFTNRWERIVRFKTTQKISLREHTDKWLTRWLRQWEKTNATKSQYVNQFRETLIAVSRDSQSPVLVQNRTTEPPSQRQTPSNI